MSKSASEQARRSRTATLTGLVNLKRLAVAALLVAVVFGALAYIDSTQQSNDGDVDVRPARLLETPQEESEQLKVFPEKGSLAPNFEATRIDGGRLQLSDFRGSPVLLKFWATWCAACLAEFPHIKEVHERLAPSGLRIVAVNAGQSRQQAKEFSDFLDAPFDWALDPGLVVSDAYKVIGFPVSVFIDRNGVIRATYVGELDAALMESFAQAAIDAVPGPEAPFKLRLINSLPRENVLLVPKSSRDGELLFAARSFRCDSSYCRDDIPSALRNFAAVRDAAFDRQSEPPLLRVFFDPTVMTDDQIIEAVSDALAVEPDPLYHGPLIIRRELEAGTEP